LWLIVLFSVLNFSYSFLKTSFEQILQNAIFCFFYFGLCWLVLKLYFKLRKYETVGIIDNMIGWGDILLMAAVGCTIAPERLFLFFTFTFVLATVVHLIFFSKKKEVPLAGYLLLVFSTYQILERFTNILNQF
jgi:hypothetical protein